MSKYAITVGNVGTSELIQIIVVGILGFFVYGSLTGALGMILLGVCLSIMLMFSIIPIIGWAIMLYLNYVYVVPKILSFTGLYSTWLTTALLIVSLIIGIVVCGFVSLVILAIYFSNKKFY